MNLKNLKPHLIFFAIAFAASLAFSLFIELAVCNFLLSRGEFYFSGVRFCSVLILAFTLISLIKFHTYFFNHLEKAFLLIALPVGFVFILVFPKTIFVSQDDGIHLARAYSLLESGDMKWPEAFRTVDYLPVSVDNLSFSATSAVYEELNQKSELTTHQKPTFVELSTAGAVQRLVYLPYYIGFKISAFLHFNFVTAFTFAKLCNYACYALLIYLAIKVSKSLKKIFFAVGLLTANIFFASQFSYDPMITASIVLAIALFCRMLEDRKARPLYAFGFVLAVIWGSLPKATYCLLLLLGLLIPASSFDHPRRAKLYKVSLVVLTLLTAATFVLPAVLGDIPGDFRGGDTSVIGQLSFILHNPVPAIMAFGRYIITDIPDFLLTHTVTTSGYHIFHYTKYVLPLANLATLAFLIFAVLTSNKPAKAYPRPVRIALPVMYSIITLAIIGALYLSFTEVGSKTISGVQPRYFLPILPLLLIFLTPTAASPLLKSQKSHQLILLLTPFLILTSIVACYLLRATLSSL